MRDETLISVFFFEILKCEVHDIQIRRTSENILRIRNMEEHFLNFIF